MGCNCGKKSSSKSFLWTAPDGKKKTTYTSEVQARAAQIKWGGTYREVSAS